MEAGSLSLNLRIMNLEFVKLDKFDGCNYTRWADKMKFLLIILKIFYVLDLLLAPIPANPIAAEGEEVDQNEVLELEKQRMICREDETLCCSRINNSLSDRIYDVYAPITDPRKLWTTLKFKYKKQEEVGNSSKRGSRNSQMKFNLWVNRNKFKKSRSSKRTIKGHVCGDTGHYDHECKLRKSKNDDVNVVNGEITD
ncbi:hypothetical protein Tco_1455599 [Tanacetum coccineum]